MKINPFHNDRFPRSNHYNPRWVAENQMGPNALWLAEWLTEALDLKPGMRVLDMGCGRAMSAIFLAREFGVTVFAADLWVSAADNWRRAQQAGVADRVFPIHAEAHALPFAEGFFDAIVSFDSYTYYGTDDLYLSYIIRFLRPDGPIGIVAPGLCRELPGPPPAHLTRPQANGKVFWEPECATFHSPDWWRRHWEKSALVRVEVADILPDGWRYWARHDEAVKASGLAVFPSDAEALEADAGAHLALVRMIARRLPPPDEGPQPHVWEPAFMAVCDQLFAARSAPAPAPAPESERARAGDDGAISAPAPASEPSCCLTKSDPASKKFD